jgi:hypothetical protein
MATTNENLVRSTEQWTRIIDMILDKRPGFLKVESTDHEYRTDDRNILAVGRQRGHWSVDGLAHNIEKDAAILRKLLETYNDILATGM